MKYWNTKMTFQKQAAIFFLPAQDEAWMFQNDYTANKKLINAYLTYKLIQFFSFRFLLFS